MKCPKELRHLKHHHELWLGYVKKLYQHHAYLVLWKQKKGWVEGQKINLRGRGLERVFTRAKLFKFSNGSSWAVGDAVEVALEVSGGQMECRIRNHNTGKKMVPFKLRNIDYSKFERLNDE